MPHAVMMVGWGEGVGGRQWRVPGKIGEIFFLSLAWLTDTQSPFSTFNGKGSQFREKEDTGFHPFHNNKST
jgi:hypothetical protein